MTVNNVTERNALEAQNPPYHEVVCSRLQEAQDEGRDSPKRRHLRNGPGPSRLSVRRGGRPPGMSTFSSVLHDPPITEDKDQITDSRSL